MRDLRKRALLESGKTVSRRAQSRQNSATNSKVNSPAGSRSASRSASRQPSDEDDDTESQNNETARSTITVDDMLRFDDVDCKSESWRTDLEDIIDQLLDSRKSSTTSRERMLSAYNYSLMTHYAHDVILNKWEDIITFLLKIIKIETSVKQTILALRALSITLITSPSDSDYESLTSLLKATVIDSGSSSVKANALQALAIATFYCDTMVDEKKEIMEYLLEIISSDGQYVNANDSSEVVASALESWGVLVTQLEDVEFMVEIALEAFMEQLESTYLNVSIAAGENIALIYEKCCIRCEENEEVSNGEELLELEDDSNAGTTIVKKCFLFKRENELRQLLSSLATISGPGISKKDRKLLHFNFADILKSVENPLRGPRYHDAVNQKNNKNYGNRLTVKINRDNEIKIDRWWKLLRFMTLKRILQSGFMIHYEYNGVVFDCLPVIIT